MKIIKSIVSILLMLILSSQSIVLAQTNDTESIALLISLGILEKGDIEQPERAVTRGEFASILEKIVFPDSKNIWNGTDVFEDVDDTHDYYSAVSAMNGIKIMVGYNKMFYPDRNVTFYEAIKSLVTMLGKELIAQQGGYPNGYLSVASSSKILKEFSNQTEHELTITEAAKLIFNTIKADTTLISLDGDKITYKTEDYVTLMGRKLNVYEEEGLFEADSVTDIFGNKTMIKGYIKIGDEIYRGSGFESFIGHKVKFYYQYDEKNNEKTVLYMQDVKRVSQLIIESNEIYSYENGVYTYTPNAATRSQKANIAVGAAVVYNGKVPVSILGEEMFTPDTGRIILIDNDDDKKYDVVFIWSYETYVVKSVGVGRTIAVTDFYEKDSLILDSEDDSYTYKFLKDGADFNPSGLEKWNVLSVAKSDSVDGERIYTILVAAKRITGTFGGTANGDITIDGNDYPLSKAYKQDNPGSGVVDFYLDAMGNVAVYDKMSVSSASVHYGILVGWRHDDSTEEPPELKIFNEAGEFVYYKTTQKIKVDGGKKIETLTLFENASVLYNGDGLGVKVQMIGFKRNLNNEITEIDTAVKQPGEDKTSLTETDFYAKNKLKYMLLGRSFSETVVLSKNMTIFKVPSDADGNILLDSAYQERFSVSTTVPFQDTYDIYPVKFFNVNEVGVTDLMIWYNEVGSGDLTSSRDAMVMVKALTQTLNEDDEVVATIIGWTDGAKEIQLNCDLAAEEQASKLKKGDIINYVKNSAGKVENIIPRYSLGDKAYYISDTGVGNYNRILFGQITAVDMDNRAFRVCYGLQEDGLLDHNLEMPNNFEGGDRYNKSTVITLYDRKKGTVRALKPEEVCVGQQVIIQKMQTAAWQMFVIEE